MRLLRGQHRMVLSGTPVENHLGELWSQFEFLNPGMLGEAKVLKMTGGLGRNPSPEARQLLRQALRPLILSRTNSRWRLPHAFRFPQALRPHPLQQRVPVMGFQFLGLLFLRAFQLAVDGLFGFRRQLARHLPAGW